MESMHELVTVAGFGRALGGVCAVWTVACVVVALMKRSALAWLAAGLGPLVVAAWWVYLWTVRVDPQTGYVGLHRVSVFVGNLIVFCALGVALGWLAARIAGSEAGPQNNNDGRTKPDREE
jgi:hypothetical protein